MRNSKLLLTSIMLSTLIAGTMLYPASVVAQRENPAPQVVHPVTPEALVQRLYAVHKKGNGPIFTRQGKRYLGEFFTPALAALLWKNIVGPPSGEVGNLDFDPLFNAQDLGLSKFRIGPAQKQKDSSRAIVLVTFKNYGHPNRILFYLRHSDSGWKIEDLDYGFGQHLVKILSQPF